MDDRNDVLRRMDDAYAADPHPWGQEPIKFVADNADQLLAGTVLDLGSGDGRNAIFLAKHGFRVVAVDFVATAIDELRRRATEAGLVIETHVADVAAFPFATTYENVVSTLTLHLVPADEARPLVERMKRHTAAGGLNLVSVFTKDGPAYRAGSPSFWLEPGELRTMYEDWEVVHSGRRIAQTLTKDEAGNPFHQPVDEVAVRKPHGNVERLDI